MQSFYIIDAHTHIFPPKIAAAASQNIQNFYDLETREIGTPERLLAIGAAAGVSRFVVSSPATARKQVESINNFIMAECEKHPELIGYMTLYPGMSEEESGLEIERCLKGGLCAVKLHPDFQRFRIDDNIARPIYRAAEGRIPILFHMGDTRYNFSHPEYLASIAKDYKNLKCMAAHMGGWSEWNSADCYKGLENIAFDTCSSTAFMDDNTLISLIRTLGTERVFFGSDFPMWRPDTEIKRFLTLAIPDAEKEMIFSKNYLNFMEMDH